MEKFRIEVAMTTEPQQPNTLGFILDIRKKISSRKQFSRIRTGHPGKWLNH